MPDQAFQAGSLPSNLSTIPAIEQTYAICALASSAARPDHGALSEPFLAASTMKINGADVGPKTSVDLVLDSLQFLRVNDICRLLRISKPTFWRLRRTQDFPKPTHLTDRVIAWNKGEVEAWLLTRVPSRTAGVADSRRALQMVDTAFGISDEPARYKR